MKTMFIMSIIGIVWFSLALILIIANDNIYYMASAVGWGILGMLYAIPFSIVVLVKSKKKDEEDEGINLDKGINLTEELLKLSELKEKGELSEDEFQAMKNDLLKK